MATTATSSAPLLLYTKLKPASKSYITRSTNTSLLSLTRKSFQVLPPWCSKTVCLPTMVVVILLIIAAFEIWMATPKYKDWQSIFLALPDSSVCKHHSQIFTNMPHLAATENNYYYAQLIRDKLESYWINTNIQNFPNDLYSRYNSSSLSLLNPDGTIREQFVLKETILPQDPTSNTSYNEHAYFGYAASGHVIGNLIYVNYASRHDFELLLSLNYTLNDTIGLCRYGGSMYRGTKVYWAQYFGLKGLIIYTDPQEYISQGRDVFPINTSLPETGYQRGSTIDGTCPGDLSPQRAKELCNKTLNETVPQIPAIPLSYGNALKLFQSLNGLDVTGISILNDTWKGALNITYHIGGNNDTVVDLKVNNILQNSTTSNVIGYIPGYKYKNESILIGNHRDAWIYGAADPISGTTVLLEIARSFGVMHRNGWRPKRNIYFASWDGEEYNLIGSTDFAESKHSIMKQLVAYINIDIAVSGFDLHINSDPLLSNWMIHNTKNIPQPYATDGTTMYDAWIASENKNIYLFGDGSDYVSFVHHFGIASVSMGFRGLNDCYHSVYDSYKWMNLLDPQWQLAQGMSLYTGLLAFSLVNNDILPYNVSCLAQKMYEWLRVNVYEISINVECNYTDINPTARHILESALDDFNAEASRLDYMVRRLNPESVYQVMELNEMLRVLPSKFLYSSGLPERSYFKNILMAPDLDSGYDAIPFPYLAYAFKFKCE